MAQEIQDSLSHIAAQIPAGPEPVMTAQEEEALARLRALADSAGGIR